MAKRVSKTGTSAKQTAAVRRTKKDVTPVKKAPVKKTPVKKAELVLTVISGNIKNTKPPKKTTKTDTSVVYLAINGNEMPQKNNRPHKTTKASVFLKVASNASRDEFNAMGEKVRVGEVQWAFFAIDGDKAYHHYKVLK